MKSLALIPFAVALVAASALIQGCTTPTRKAEVRPPALLSASVARSVAIFRSDGTNATWDDLLAAAHGADVVIIGEQHGNAVGLSAAAALWRDILAASPSKDHAALALEFIERDDQSRLDDFLSGFGDEAVFMKRSGRNSSGESGGNWPEGHRDMVLAAKESGRPVYAANAPRQYVRLARTQGFDALDRLTPEQRRLVRVPEVLPTDRYRDDFYRMMAGDPMEATAEDRGRAEAMFRSQSVWDWTMADAVARSLASGNRPTVLVVGQFHSDFGGGLMQALRLMHPGVNIVSVSCRSEVSKRAQTLDVEERGRATFIIGTGE